VGETLSATLSSIPSHVAMVLNQTGGGSTILLSEAFEAPRRVPDPSNVNWFNYDSTGQCDWEYRKSITIPAAKVIGTLSDFPVLIYLASDIDLAAYAKDDGTSIVFTTSDGTTKLSHEIESFTKATGTLTAWVKVPSLSSSEDTVLWMYYGNTGAADQQDVANVWSNGYNAVWHLKEAGSGAAGEYLDSTMNGNDGQGGGGTATQVPTEVGGKIATAQEFDGDNDHIVTGSDSTIDQIWAAGGTFSAWIRPDTIGENSEGRISDKTSAATAAYGWCLATYTGNELRFRRGYATTVGAWTTPADSLVMGSWHHVVVTYTDGTANDPTIYLDGNPVPVTENAAPGGTQRSDAGYSWRIGNRAGGTNYSFDGIIDEIRASKSIRSADWIATEYENQNDPPGFISAGSAEEWWKCPME
jgi:hypothetical protein